jgi:type IV pilus assembly protein PilF
MKTGLAALLAVVVVVLAAGCSITSTERRESPTEAARYNALLGIEYLRRGELATARDKIERALKFDSNLAVAHTAAGMLYDRLAEPDRADRHFKSAIRRQSDDPELLNHYGVFLCRQSRVDEGVQMILKAARNPIYPSPYLAYTNAGLCMSGAGRMKEAEQHYMTALQLRPKFTRALAELAGLHHGRGDNQQARVYIDRFLAASRELLTADPELPGMLWLGVRVERALDNPDQADAYGRRLKTEFPQAEQTRALVKSEQSAG